MSDPSSSGLVVGIGASAGGLEALKAFFREMPRHPGMAFVVVQHLSPNHRSLMVELLSQATVLEVVRAEDGMELRNDVVHLLPPQMLLRMEGRTLRLDAQAEPRNVNLPINLFFRSLAVELGEESVGVVLSGTGSDGTLGIRAIKGAGGLVMVQDPASAKFDGMPRSALQTRLVDVMQSPEALCNSLLRVAEFPLKEEQETEMLSNMQQVLEVLRVHSDIDFSQYRISTLARRVERRMQLTQIDEPHRYLQLLRQDPGEVTALHNDVLIGVTRFFRDQDAYDALADALRIELAEHPEDEDFRVWCVGSSTGEEPYSMAILINEVAEELGKNIRLKLFATDVDRIALRTAGQGTFPESIASDVPSHLLTKYFRHSTGEFRVTEHLRKQILFSYHNVLSDPPFHRLALASIRNVMIYFQVEAQQRVLANLSFALHPEGVLVLGPSESVGDLASDFGVLNSRWNIYKRRPLPRRHAPHAGPVRTTSSRFSRTTSDTMIPVAPRSSTHAEREVFRHVMTRHAPATLIVDDAHRVAMAFGPVSQYVQVPVGTMSADLQAMVGGSLGVVIAGGLHRARDAGQSVQYQAVESAQRGSDASHLVDIIIDPLPTISGSLGLFAVVIRPQNAERPPSTIAPLNLPQSQHLHDLQEELQYTRESLQATIEELETSNEELQAMNEELLASNEELQSTNEELQSVNEELITVNAEYQSKIDELEQLYTDMDNVFTTSGTGTLFLDDELRIRKFSPAVAGHFNLVAKDIGRPLNHFSFGFDYPQFFEDTRSVLETLEPITRDVERGDKWFLIKIAPYLARGQAASGVVVTFVDITARRRTDQELVDMREQLAMTQERGQRRVLVVEDDADHAALIRIELTNSPWVSHVDGAQTGEAALEMLRDGLETDLVLLDLGLPDISGFEVLRAIRQDPKLSTLPVVVVSGQLDPSLIQTAYELRANCFVTKPNLPQRLSAVIRQVNEYWFSVVEHPASLPENTAE